ncbi:MAG: prenyltransferase [Betaproteobacteria bacterium]|nr:prenyltransferase [Betaproteobacteria bacterium]
MTLNAYLGPLRLPFLLLTPACLLVGLAVAHRAQAPLAGVRIALVLIGGLAAHVSVNAFNEYLDFRSGLDARTVRTPFSGGSGALPGRPDLAPFALLVAVGALGVTIAVGLYFVRLHGSELLPIGLLGVLLVLTYTTWLTRHPVLCLLAPGLGFGPLMVVGTEVALTGRYTATGLAASLVPLFLVSDLLLLNQFPDAEADRSVGRRHALIAWGPHRAAWLFAAFLACAYGALVVSVLAGALPLPAMVAGLTAPIAVVLAAGVVRHAADVPRLLRYMALNVVVCLVTPVLLATGLVLG